jgi:hypothetical protein
MRHPGGRRTRADAGVSLVELAVAAAITSVVLAAVGAVFVGALRTVRTVNSQTSTSADARIGMESITRSLRVAVRPDGLSSALVSATASSLSFYALINRTGVDATATLAPTLVEFSYDGTCIREAHTPARTLSSPPTGGPFYAWDTGRTEKCLIRTTTAPAFAYYTTPVLASGGTDIAPLTLPGSGLAAATLPTVQSIQITLVVKDAANPSLAGVTNLSRVTLDNVVSDTGGSS